MIALQAIVASILTVGEGRPELMRRLFVNVVVTGPGAGLAGLGDALERRVFAKLPNDCKVGVSAACRWV